LNNDADRTRRRSINRSQGERNVSQATKARGFAYWALKVFAVIVALFGLALAVGGVWLITLGGSWWRHWP